MNSVPFTIIATGALVGIAASLLGTFLVLRKNAMLTDAISHSIVFGIVIVWLLTRQQSGPVQLVGAALSGVLTVFLTELLTRTRRVKSDAAIGLVFPVLFSVGVLLLNLYARDVHIDTHTVLLGEIGFVWLNTTPIGGVEVPVALAWMSVVTVVNLAFVTGFYKELKISTFDPALATSLGFLPGALFYALLTLTSVTAVAAFDAVGAVLFIAFAIVPPATGYLLTDRLWRMIAYGALASILASVIGYLLANAWNVSIGGMMAVVAGALLMLAFLFGPRYGLIAQEVARRTQRLANQTRALSVHLYNHEHEGPSEENVVGALQRHLRWTPEGAQRVLLRALDRGMVERDGQQLRLTPKGRIAAREVLEPWGARSASGSGEDA
ncbi:MAG: metal ABC transporter permease [Trueperaceae bacterium]|nr:metal ABC transporter permease [Trueperaceae bacterium]